MPEYPENVTYFGQVSWENEPYQFYITEVLHDDAGFFYWATDSGCSCPLPFEDVVFPDDYEKGTKDELLAYLKDRRDALTSTFYFDENGEEVIDQDEELYEYVNNQIVRLFERIYLNGN